jgi:hypothetical protein
MKDNKTTVSQKIALIIFGIMVAAIAVELLLRICGAIFLLYTEGTRTIKAETGIYKILCPGRSCCRWLPMTLI